MNFDAIDVKILGPAFLAGIIVLVSHVPLGMQVLRRGIVFIDLAIAQIAGLGVILADLLGYEPQGIAVQVSATGAALLGAVLLSWMEKRMLQVQEALIGVLFVLAASAGILLLANNPHGGEHLKDLLVGQILWVSFRQLVPAFALTAAFLAIWTGMRGNIKALGFYVLFSFMVTASVQLVGVYLVFASLIVPAVATVKYCNRYRSAVAYLIGLSGYGIGLLLSASFDLPSGAVIVWVMALIGVVAYNLSGFFVPEGKVS